MDFLYYFSIGFRINSVLLFSNVNSFGKFLSECILEIGPQKKETDMTHRQRNKLTAIQVAKAKCSDKTQRISDGGNLYLCLNPSGSKTWQFRYLKLTNKKPTYYALGAYPDVSLAKAREKASELRKMLKNGIDPIETKKQKEIERQEKEKITFHYVAKLWMDSKRNRIKPKTIEGNWRKLELYAFPALGELPISTIKAPMAIMALRDVEKAGYLETVKRTAQLMNEVMTYAVNYGFIHANPLSGIKKVFQQPVRTHLAALKPEELQELMQRLSLANIYIGTRCLIEWQLHTMVRPNEASGARWDEINFKEEVWAIPASRMKANKEHLVPLTPHTMNILKIMKPLSGHRDYIFPSPRDPKKPTDSETANKALSRMGFKDRTTAHGLRALASTTLNTLGKNKDLIEASLSHGDPDQIRAAYNRADYLKARRELMNYWSDYIYRHSFGSYSITSVMERSQAS